MRYFWIVCLLCTCVLEAKTVCLNMIVKNESKVIERCLNTCKEAIDYWVIVDTGSTDGTQELIRNILKDKPGVLYERPWVNFEHNRNEALLLAKNKCDYILLIDADETLQFSEPFNKEILEKDMYLYLLCEPQTRCYRTFLLKNSVDWRWEGVIHERIVGPPGYTQEVYPNLVNVSYTGQGCRSQNPNKYRDDAIMLEKELKKDPNNGYNLFFLAQSYVLCKEYRKAMEAYERCAAMTNNAEVAWFCRYAVIRLHDACNDCPDTIIDAYCRNYMERPTRAEPLYYLAKHLFERKNFILSYAIAKYALTIPMPQDQNSHIEYGIYEHGLRDLINSMTIETK